jgi:hypothetical protein
VLNDDLADLAKELNLKLAAPGWRSSWTPDS